MWRPGGGACGPLPTSRASPTRRRDFDSNTATRLTTSTFDILKANPALGRAEALRRASLDYLNDRTNSQNAYPAHRGIMRMDQCVWRMSTRHLKSGEYCQGPHCPTTPGARLVSWVWLGSLSALSVVRRWAPGRDRARVTAREPPAAPRVAGSRVALGCAPVPDWGSPASAAGCWGRPVGLGSAYEGPQFKSFCLEALSLRYPRGDGQIRR
jgi:hypothetical protein